jgi:hypothetical protein
MVLRAQTTEEYTEGLGSNGCRPRRRYAGAAHAKAVDATLCSRLVLVVGHLETEVNDSVARVTGHLNSVSVKIGCIPSMLACFHGRIVQAKGVAERSCLLHDLESTALRRRALSSLRLACIIHEHRSTEHFPVWLALGFLLHGRTDQQLPDEDRHLELSE